ncbi:MAG: glycosyltransferase family 2 protein [Flavitalea sp.]
MFDTAQLQKLKRSGPGKKFSILIPTWNNLSYLQLCIDSIRKNSTYKHQVIVHINEGTDGSYDWVKSQQDLDYTFSKKNIGVCYALNYSRTIAETDFIVYVNDDMYLCPGWDDELVREIDQIGHNAFFLSSTAIEPVASSNCVIEKNYGTDPSTFKEKELLNEFRTLEFNDWQGATWPPNIIHKDLWDYIGGYSIEFSPGMYSDPDFSMKLWKAGVRIFKGVSLSRAYHFGSKSTKRVKKNKGYYQFIAKWGFTSSVATKIILRRGEKFDGLLKEPVISGGIKWKNIIKRLGVAVRNPFE